MIKYAAIGLILGIVIGFWQGDNYRAGVVAEAAQEAQAKAQRQQTKVIHKSVQNEQAREVEFRTVEKEVIKYVTRPDRDNCKFDADRVRIKQRAVDAANGIGN